MLQNTEVYAVPDAIKRHAMGISANAALLLLLDEILLGLDSLGPLGPASIVDSVHVFRVSNFCESRIENTRGNSGAAGANDRLVQLDVMRIEVELQLIRGHKSLLSRVEDMVEGDVCGTGHVAG